MINVIIFSLFMFILNIDAAEGPALKDFGWSARDCVQAHYDTLKFNLRRTCIELKDEDKDNAFVLQDCYVVLEEFYPVEELISEWRTCNATLPACKVMLPECDMLSPCKVILDACALLCKRFLKEIFSTQLDTSIILYLLRKKSEENAKELAKTFMVEGAKVMEGQITLFDALGRCVPEVQSREEVRTALSDFPSVKNRDAIVGNVMNNYSEHTGSKRFFVSLECVFGKTPCVAPTPDPTILGQEHPWCAGASVQKYYQIMQTNLQNCGIIVEHSFMLRICSMFPHVFPDQLHLMKRELDLIMYILCKESSTNTEKLAETFIAEEGGLQQGVSTLIDAFGRCVPEVGCEDIANVLDNYPTGELRIYKKVFRGIIKRYTHKEGAKRFLPSIKNLVDFMCECIDFWPW